MSGLKQITDGVTHVIKAERGFEILKMKTTVVSLLLSTAAVSVWAKPVYTGSAATQEFRAHEGGLPPAEEHAFAATSVRTVNVRTTKELFAARDRLRKKKPSVPVDVRIAPGEYFFEQPFALTASDSGSATAPIRYVGAGTATVFTAATRVPAARFQTWRNGILVADIADLGVRFPDRTKILGVRQSPPPVPEVFVDGTRYEMASWPNDRQWTTFTNIVTVGAGWADKDVTNKLGRLNVPGTFGYDGDRPSRWTQAPYVWIHGYFRWDWRDNLLPVGRIDPKERTITLGARATYGLARAMRGRAARVSKRTASERSSTTISSTTCPTTPSTSAIRAATTASSRTMSFPTAATSRMTRGRSTKGGILRPAETCSKAMYSSIAGKTAGTEPVRFILTTGTAVTS